MKLFCLGILLLHFALDAHGENIPERISLGYLPKATHWIGGVDLSLLAETETLLPLPTKLNDLDLRFILRPEAFDSVFLNGKAFALPVGIHLQSSAVYNKRVLAKIGQSSMPMAWNTFSENAEKLEDYECSGLPGLQIAYFQTDIFVLFNNNNPDWNENPKQRFIGGQRDVNRVALLHGLLPKIWANTSITSKKASRLIYEGLRPKYGS